MNNYNILMGHYPTTLHLVAATDSFFKLLINGSIQTTTIKYLCYLLYKQANRGLQKQERKQK